MSGVRHVINWKKLNERRTPGCEKRMTLFGQNYMYLKYNIIVVGAGGTGGNLIPWLGRFLRFWNRNEGGVSKDWCLTIVDGDKVEGKNLARQPFVDFDEQQPKAFCLKEGLVDCLGLADSSVSAYCRYIDTENDLLEAIHAENSKERDGEIDVLIGAVDNHKARQVMHNFFYNSSSCVYIDAANEFDYGEICVGVRLGGKNIAPPRAYYFPEVLTDKSPSASETSCGVINESAPQHIVTNLLSAVHTFSIVTKLLQDDVVEGGILTFNTDHYSRFERFTKRCPSRKRVMEYVEE